MSACIWCADDFRTAMIYDCKNNNNNNSSNEKDEFILQQLYLILNVTRERLLLSHNTQTT